MSTFVTIFEMLVLRAQKELEAQIFTGFIFLPYFLNSLNATGSIPTIVLYSIGITTVAGFRTILFQTGVQS